MAIAFGSAIGNGSAGSGDGTTVAITTTATVPSGGHIILSVSYYNNVTISSTSGGFTWVVDAVKQSAGDSNYRIALMSARATSQFNSGSTITVTYSGNAFARTAVGMYFTDIASSSWEDAQSAGANGTGLPWNSGALTTTTANTVVVGSCWQDFTNDNTAPDAPFLEAVQFLDATNNLSHTVIYRIVSSASTYTPSGDWALSGNVWVGTAVAYKEAAAAGPTAYSIQPPLIV